MTTLSIEDLKAWREELAKVPEGPWSPMRQNSRATESGWPKTITGWEVPIQVGEGKGAGNTFCRVYMGGPAATRSTQETVEPVAEHIARYHPATTAALIEGYIAMAEALRVYGEWAIDVSTLGEFSDLEKRMNAAGITFTQLGEWASPKKPLAPALEAAAKAQPSISTGQGEAEEWCCSKCGCRSHARVDERQSDGRFAPGSRVRCVHCKDVSYFPSLPAGHVAVPVEPTDTKGE